MNRTPSGNGRPLAFDPIAEARNLWEQHWGQDLASEMGAVTSLMRAQQILLMDLNRVLRPFRLTFARYELLMLLTFSQRGALPLGKIGQRLQVHPTSVTAIVDRLERDGLVERVPHATDRRTMEAALTTGGRRLGEIATKALQEQFTVGGLAEDELDQITTLVRKLRSAAGDFVDTAPVAAISGTAPGTTSGAIT